jgi:hypothetical protein
MSGNPDDYRDWDAAYVLGALGAADRAAFERHIATCAPCTAAVTELAGMPGILSRLSTEEAVALTAGPAADHLREARHEWGLSQRLAASVGRQRRRSRVLLTALAGGLVAASVATGLVIGAATVRGPEPTPDPIAITTPVPVPEIEFVPAIADTVTASLTIEQGVWGTRFGWSCEYAPGDWGKGLFVAGEPWRYELVAIDAGGAETVVATWLATEEPAEGLSAVSAIAADSVTAVEIRAIGSGTVLARAEV